MSGYQDLAELGLRCRPIDSWPGQLRADADRIPSPFEATMGSTVEILARELKMLDAERIVLQLAIPESRIRVDGLPYADAKTAHPGVILAFDSKHGPLKYATDHFTNRAWRQGSGAAWQHNLRAVALALEALRKVDRYGVSRRGEQYRGYAELPAGIAMPPTHMTTEEAAKFVAKWGGGGWQDLLDRPELRPRSYQRAAQALHPDRPDGSTELFQLLQAAKALLEREGGA